MNLRILLARRISKRLECEARVHRRALCDHLRQETSRIRRLEIRSRGLPLCGVVGECLEHHPGHAEDWHQAELPQGFPEIDTETAATAYPAIQCIAAMYDRIHTYAELCADS
jgi:hypothetical protein